MAYPIKDNPEGCCCPNIRGEQTCIACYYSFVENGQWTGSQQCWNSKCLELDINRLSDYQKAQMHI